MHRTTQILLIAACCLFILLGSAVIPYAGIQDDEALFASPLYHQITKEFRARLFHTDIPLMVMSYIGTLKTLIYGPILTWFGANVWTVRLPMVLAGALTVFVFFHMANRAAGRRAAVLGSFLLATDPMLVLMNTFDWGPVALEHLLLVTACFFLLRFAQESRNRDLWLGFFFLGLALWNKAIFLWALAGLSAAGASIFGKKIGELLSWKRVLLALAGFVLGALPFLIYNLRHLNATLKNNAGFADSRELPSKFIQLRHVLSGESLFGFIAAEDSTEQPKGASSLRGRAATWIHTRLGDHRRSGLIYAIGLLLLVIPLWWRSRAAWFCIVFCTVAWFSMAFTRDAGAAAHHAVLLWPFPHFFVAVAIAQVPWRWLAAAAAVVLVGFNLLVMNQYLYQFERNGSPVGFSDAIFALSAAIPENPGQHVYMLNWGTLNTISLLHRGRVAGRVGSEPFMRDETSPSDRRLIAYMLQDSGALFVNQVPGQEIFEGTGRRAEAAAKAAGYRKDLIQTIADSNGRPVFEIFRFVR